MKGGVKVKVYSKKFFSVIITFFLLCSCCFVAKAEVLNADDAQYSTQRYSTVESNRCGIKNSGANALMYPSSYNWSFGTTSDSYYYAYFYDSTPIYFATNGI